MALGKREKAVAESGTCPFKGAYRVTDRAILRKSCLIMIRACCCLIIFKMAVDAIYPNNIKSYKTLGLMTLVTISGTVSTQQWETAHPVNLINIIYQP
jgi:hypothetical protein